MVHLCREAGERCVEEEREERPMRQEGSRLWWSLSLSEEG